MAQALPRHGTDVAAVHGDGAVLHVVEAHEEVDERRLAAARRADDGYALAGPDREVQILDEPLLRRVGEGDIRQLHAAGGVGQHPGIGRVGDLRRLVDELEDPRGAGQRVLQLGDDAGDLIEGLGVLVGIAEEARQPADRDGPRHRAQRPGKAHAGVDDIVDDAGRGVRHRREEGRAHGRGGQAVIDLVKLRKALGLMRERLHDALAAELLIDERGLLAAGLGLRLEHGVGVPRDELRHQQG